MKLIPYNPGGIDIDPVLMTEFIPVINSGISIIAIVFVTYAIIGAIFLCKTLKS